VALLAPAAARLLNRARSEWEQGRFDAARRSLASVLSLAPGDPVATFMLGLVSQRLGDHANAIECFRRILPAWPDDFRLRTGLGISLNELGEVDRSISEFRRACELAPESVHAWFNLAEALARHSEATEAVAALQRVLGLDPAHCKARLSLARAQTYLGDIDAAVTEFRRVLLCDPYNPEAWSGLANLNTVRFDDADVAQLRQALASRGIIPRARELLTYALGKALEDQGDYAQAFELFGRANASRRRRTKWDAVAEHAHARAITGIFGADIPPAPDPGLGREAIFIVSIARSGSSLVEQILASHPQVEGANEIQDLRKIVDAESRRRGSPFPTWVPEASAEDWLRLGREYMARTARWRESKPRFTDKSLVTWPLVGAVEAMLPAAKVVIVRRDPVETCLGCYRQCFGETSGFACDLDEMAEYYSDFFHTTRFWLRRYPTRVHDLKYEDLVAAPEDAIRGLLAFCELPFDPACVKFHETSRIVRSLPSAAQIRQPLRKDTSRSALYGEKLDSLRQRLKELGC
jgi:tetratricopeptide (TPR) repeat protein